MKNGLIVIIFLIYSQIIVISAQTVYNFDDVEVLYAARFEASLINADTGTWVDTIDTNKKIRVIYGTVNLIGKTNATEEFIKIGEGNNSRRFLVNSVSIDYYKECNEGACINTENTRKIKSFFWSAKKLEGNVIVKDFSPPIYSVILIREYDTRGSIVSFKLSFSNNGELHQTQFWDNSEIVQYKSLVNVSAQFGNPLSIGNDTINKSSITQSCRALWNLTLLTNGKNCGDDNYNNLADINKDGRIIPLDSLLIPNFDSWEHIFIF